MNHQRNIIRIKAVSNALEDLKDRAVFVGGATVSLYADRVAPEVRETDDVDVLVEITSRQHLYLLDEQLRKRGFILDTESKFTGRYKLHGIIVDVMPTDEAILGFSNKWYLAGFSSSVDHAIDEQHNIKIFTAPYFLASKFQAFKDRGENDGRISRDFEDIVFILENRRKIWQEIKEAPASVKSYLTDEFKCFSVISIYMNGLMRILTFTHRLARI